MVPIDGIREPATTETRYGPGRPRINTLGGRKKRLLDTARRLLIDRGPGGVAMAEIAKTAGVALRTIYLQYESKEGLLRALIDDESARHDAELAALQLDRKPWHEQLACLAVHVARRTSQPELMRLCDIVMGSGDAAMVEALDNAGPGKAREALLRALAAAVGAEPLHALHSCDDLCDHFMACIAGRRFGTRAAAGDFQERARRGLDLFLRVLQVRV
jgi:AcrR family transcriptional regulator